MQVRNNHDKLIDSTFPKYCGMIIAATIAATLSSFVDGCITGKLLGSAEMAAFGIAMPFVLILIVVPGIILSSGGSICSSRLLGENMTERAGSNFTACCCSGIAVGLIGGLLCLTVPKQLVSIAGATGEVAAEAANYLRGYSLGTIPTVLLTVLMYYANLDGNEKLSLGAVAIMSITDIILDLILGVRLKMGLLGMALATSISYLCAFIYFIAIFLKKSSFKLIFSSLKQELSAIIKNGYPSALNTLLISARCFSLNLILIAAAGQAAVTAFSFQSNFNQFFVAIASGISSTVSALTGLFIGEKDRTKVSASLKAGIRTGIIMTLILAALLFSLAPVLANALISGTAEEIQYSVDALRFFSLSMPFSAICIVFISFYQTLGNRKLANAIAIGHGFVFIVLSALILRQLFGLRGVWLSTLSGELMMLLILFFMPWVKKKKMPVCLDDFIFSDENLFRAENDVFALSGSCRDAAFKNGAESGLREYLTARDTAPEMLNACCDTLLYICDSGQNSFADIQASKDAETESSIDINVRFCGEEIYDSLTAGKALEAETLLRGSGLQLNYRRGAGISFINISGRKE